MTNEDLAFREAWLEAALEALRPYEQANDFVLFLLLNVAALDACLTCCVVAASLWSGRRRLVASFQLFSAVASCWCCPRCLFSAAANLCDLLWVVSGHISSFSFFFLSSPLFSSLSFAFLPHFFHPLWPTSPSCTRRAPSQTFPITRTITIKAKLSIKGMISPQWPMPWRGWVPLRLSQPCPAAQAPSPACTTASCSARAARRPSRGLRWSTHSDTGQTHSQQLLTVSMLSAGSETVFTVAK